VSAGPGPGDGLIAMAVSRLRSGGLVAFPTETVYGLGADALSESAVRRVFELKGRPARNPLIVHVADEVSALTVAAEWPDRARRLAARFWPGPLTIVVARGPRVPGIVTAGAGTVALRCPDHPVALALLRAFGGPLVGPSANPSGRVSPTTAARVSEAFSERAVMVLDGGPCREGIESTVVSVVSPTVRVLRQGAVSAADIGEALGEPVKVEWTVDSGAPLGSPGLMERHYAPRTRAVLFDTPDWPRVIDSASGPVVVLTHIKGRRIAPPHRLIEMPDDDRAYAARLYEAMHEADGAGASLIAIELPGDPGPVWDAVRDRLQRATA